MLVFTAETSDLSQTPGATVERGYLRGKHEGMEGHHLIERRYQTRRWCFPRKHLTLHRLGTTWTENTSTGSTKRWYSITSSSDGTNLPLLFTPKQHLLDGLYAAATSQSTKPTTAADYD